MTLSPSPDHPLPWHVESHKGLIDNSRVYVIFAKNGKRVVIVGIGARAEATAAYIVAAANAFPEFIPELVAAGQK